MSRFDAAPLVFLVTHEFRGSPPGCCRKALNSRRRAKFGTRTFLGGGSRVKNKRATGQEADMPTRSNAFSYPRAQRGKTG